MCVYVHMCECVCARVSVFLHYPGIEFSSVLSHTMQQDGSCDLARICTTVDLNFPFVIDEHSSSAQPSTVYYAVLYPM